MIKEAIILAGGLGTRLKSMIQDIPKPMAPINGKPFLEFLLIYLQRNNIKRVIISSGFRHEIISSYFGRSFRDMDIIYAVEKEPLGTGGGIMRAIDYLDNNFFYMLNGDTFFNVDLAELFRFNSLNNFHISLSLKKMYNFDRYGSVQFSQNRIVSFNPRVYCDEGFINGGVYLLDAELLNSLNFPEKFSFENDFLNVYPDKMLIGAFQSKDYFIDIGIPEDYLKAQKELLSFLP